MKRQRQRVSRNESKPMTSIKTEIGFKQTMLTLCSFLLSHTKRHQMSDNHKPAAAERWTVSDTPSGHYNPRDMSSSVLCEQKPNPRETDSVPDNGATSLVSVTTKWQPPSVRCLHKLPTPLMMTMEVFEILESGFFPGMSLSICIPDFSVVLPDDNENK